VSYPAAWSAWDFMLNPKQAGVFRLLVPAASPVLVTGLPQFGSYLCSNLNHKKTSMKHLSIFAIAGIFVLFSCSDKGVTYPLDTRKVQVVTLLKSIETGNQEPVAFINPKKYIQHNLNVPDGLGGFLAFLQSLPPNSVKVNTKRVFRDGDYVFTHSDYSFFGPKAGFDIFRYENDRIVEHWDNLQEKPATPNPSGHTMTDGAVLVKDLHNTGQNKNLVRNFVTDILVNGNLNKLQAYFKGDNYIQHNPNIGDGVSGLLKAIGELAQQGIVFKYDKLHVVVGEGDFVLTVSEGNFAGKPTAFYDLFRIENDKIAEHWDTVETIPPQSEWKNSNGKFGFK